nr:hypothetical protein Itr_chr13CG15900 [Ipomoea trifida]
MNLPSSSLRRSLRREEKQPEIEDGDAATVRHRGVYAAATVNVLNLPKILAPSLLPCVVETRGGKLSRSCLARRKGQFTLPPECSALSKKGRSGNTIVGVAAIALFVAKLRRRINNPH